MHNLLSEALLPYLSPGQGGIPLNINVTVTPSDEVLQLRKELEVAKAENAELMQKLQRCEFLLECNYHVHAQVLEYLKQNKIAIPRNVRAYEKERHFKIIYE